MQKLLPEVGLPKIVSGWPPLSCKKLYDKLERISTTVWIFSRVILRIISFGVDALLVRRLMSGRWRAEWLDTQQDAVWNLVTAGKCQL